MRQITGFMGDYWRLLGLDIAVPSSGQLSERSATLSASVRQRCQKVVDRVPSQ